jgi:hypothetical protein
MASGRKKPTKPTKAKAKKPPARDKFGRFKKKPAPRKRKPTPRDIGLALARHLNAARKFLKSGDPWRVTTSVPRKFWARRFRARPDGESYFDVVEEGIIRFASDDKVDRVMTGRTVAIVLHVAEPTTGRRLVLSSVTGGYERVINDILDKLRRWALNYGPVDDEDEEAWLVLQLTLLTT